MKSPTNILVRSFNTARTRTRGVLWAFLIAMALLTVVSQARDAENPETNPDSLAGKAAPDFTLTNLSGATVRLSDFKGKVVLLDFWATWCPPCRREIPDFTQLQRQYGVQGFTMLGIALDDEGAAVVKPFAQKLGVNYPLVIGNTKIAAAYGGIQALPTAFLIGRDGKVVKSIVGARDKSAWEQTIESQLRQTKD